MCAARQPASLTCSSAHRQQQRQKGILYNCLRLRLVATQFYFLFLPFPQAPQNFCYATQLTPSSSIYRKAAPNLWLHTISPNRRLLSQAPPATRLIRAEGRNQATETSHITAPCRTHRCRRRPPRPLVHARRRLTGHLPRTDPRLRRYLKTAAPIRVSCHCFAQSTKMVCPVSITMALFA